MVMSCNVRKFRVIRYGLCHMGMAELLLHHRSACSDTHAPSFHIFDVGAFFQRLNIIL